MTRTIELSGLALSVVLALGVVVGTASARDDQRDYRGNEHREYHRGNEGWNNGYRAPPVVYGGPGYYPPPVVYGSGLGININIP
jgi:hypothetical protein